MRHTWSWLPTSHGRRPVKSRILHFDRRFIFIVGKECICLFSMFTRMTKPAGGFKQPTCTLPQGCPHKRKLTYLLPSSSISPPSGPKATVTIISQTNSPPHSRMPIPLAAITFVPDRDFDRVRDAARVALFSTPPAATLALVYCSTDVVAGVDCAGFGALGCSSGRHGGLC